MQANEVVISEVKRDGGAEILALLAESVCQASQAAHVHPHRQILALNVGRGNQIGVWIASNDNLPHVDQLRGAVSPLLGKFYGCVNFNQLAVVSIGTESTFYSVNVGR